jgi:PIN domain nuclease of toxin-antitoxin system
MKLLLDTHVFLWWALTPERLPRPVMAACTDPATTLLFSTASVWEIQIKAALGKLTLHQPLPEVVASQLDNGLQLLPITLDHALRVGDLPLYHKDPFDRMLIAQALVEDAVLASADAAVAAYPVARLWN